MGGEREAGSVAVADEDGAPVLTPILVQISRPRDAQALGSRLSTRTLPCATTWTSSATSSSGSGSSTKWKWNAVPATCVWADSAYAGQLVTWAKTYLNLTIKTVSRPKDASGFVVLPRRWVVEICQAQCTHGVCCCAVSAVSVQMRRLYQPGGRVRRSRSSASSRWSAWAMRRWGQQLSRRVVIQPRLIQA